jgi:pterin-4a-carbinolamine dehydratase
VRWNRVTITLTTHAIKGLSINDFIMAAKIADLYGSS